MESNDVTLGERASKLCASLGIPENALQKARSGSISEHEGREFLIVIGELPDGRSVRMMCRFDRTNHIVTFRTLDA
jgi:hypothetical protein